MFIDNAVTIRGNVTIKDNTKIYYGTEICTSSDSSCIVGKNCVIGRMNVLVSFNELIIENYALFAAGVKIFNGNHGVPYIINEEAIVNSPLYGEKMVVGKNCWLGFDVKIIKGGQIGDNCIVGANSLINSNIPPNSIAVGIPAKVIKERKDIKSVLLKRVNHLIKVNQIPNKIVIYGAGSILKTILPLLKERIILVVDMDINKIGGTVENIHIKHPNSIKDVEYDKIIITVLGREHLIKAYLINTLKIDVQKIFTLDIDKE
ncbi:acyltransferase [Aliarcobacter butzleri]|nr:acyltransferase [Aliarcobacter butzleri]MCG3683702.1 acyltransferase [Aliarcobacter butzleri]MCG3697865.1 acyltransferase [Aliarcobacter butzleri]MCG3699895.1 acyltransferase [Aliarcobacter butzleri]